MSCPARDAVAARSTASNTPSGIAGIDRHTQVFAGMADELISAIV